MQSRIEFDLHYLQNWSIWLDLWIILRTVGVVLRRDNAY
jgi:putative colanic acid biosynthesis UDP-glucose lipid carrier transferase